MYSAYHCKCGCGENVLKSGDYIPGHESTRTARQFREFKKQHLDNTRKEKVASRKLPPNFGRGAGQPVQAAQPTPVKAPHFGRPDGKR